MSTPLKNSNPLQQMAVSDIKNSLQYNMVTTMIDGPATVEVLRKDGWKVTGTLIKADEDNFTLEVDGAAIKELTIPYNQVFSIHCEFKKPVESCCTA